MFSIIVMISIVAAIRAMVDDSGSSIKPAPDDESIMSMFHNDINGNWRGYYMMKGIGDYL